MRFEILPWMAVVLVLANVALASTKSDKEEKLISAIEDLLEKLEKIEDRASFLDESIRRVEYKTGRAKYSRADPYFPCPNPVDIAPCICTVNEIEVYMDMDCSGIVSNEDLRRVFSSTMPFYRYRQLTIAGVQSSQFTTLDEFSFGPVGFEIVNITGTLLQFIQDGTFAPSEEYLTALHLTKNKIKTFPFESLKTLTALTTLDLSYNDLGIVQNLESSSLRTLNLGHNPSLEIGSQLILSMPALTRLYLQNGNLSSFDPGELGPNGLTYINLANNKITNLIKDSIASTNSWTTVHLDGNPLSNVDVNFLSEVHVNATIALVGTEIVEFDKDVWRAYLERLTYGKVDMTNNPLRCGCDIAWLYDAANLYTKLSDTSACSDGTLLSDIPPEAFPFHCP
ncbi:oplophorus-luciferin 2-monooxygenase non-catalytic subunit [Hyalella azteca]|uniref:Oplophorus-luciferin 2-monooxygenase non-catalytic subunit n=1 Tax=Hyalella azteca TaxID=294128 RepID=A0A8B7PQA8_HYAAZ|nr:oplophorus-luciferin 2-monooxygenase non-catalytic subunit [Hyalella azteca]